MPILKAEPMVHPANLLDECAAGAASPGRDKDDAEQPRWWVLHTKPRQEKALARELLHGGIPYFLPLYEYRRRRTGGRLFRSYMPLFDGYLFLYAGRAQRLAALGTHRVVHSIGVADQQRLCYDLRQIKRLLDTNAPVTPEQKLAPGDEVVIRSGPLAGLAGVIVASATGQRFVVRVDFIQRGASVVLEDVDVMPREG
jgi:transcription antitermination factor NusG